MTRVVKSTAEGIAVVERDGPPGSGVLLDVAAASICGTDLHLARFGALPFVLGHELAGRVGGVPYAIEPTLFCGHCAQCGIGATQRCVGCLSLMGFFSDGGMADAVRVPESALVPLPDTLPLADACLVEPLAVAIHAVRRAELQPGQTVAVVGGGASASPWWPPWWPTATSPCSTRDTPISRRRPKGWGRASGPCREPTS
ncbi:MAG: alcohol dehydrogenase catalytic domain-containing protein [Myxococcota bacterium]|nr:alcohol dehydrogenase catalytic domain-containing protein [Myxococcota bacterium]